jgi:HAD domain in Swiss Army Knife RNA repair proteins
MNVIFLDVDGVLNTVGLLYHYGFEYIDEDMVELLSKLVRKTGSKIVLSSTWRLDNKSRGLVDEALARYGMSILDRTPKIEGAVRSEEISDWLGRHPEVVRYAIIDDTAEAGMGLEKNFFRTDPDIGLDEKTVGEIFRHLGSQKAS